MVLLYTEIAKSLDSFGSIRVQLQKLWLTKNYGDKQCVYPDVVYEYSCKDVDLGAKDNYKTIYTLIEYTEKLSEVVKIVIMIQN